MFRSGQPKSPASLVLSLLDSFLNRNTGKIMNKRGKRTPVVNFVFRLMQTYMGQSMVVAYIGCIYPQNCICVHHVDIHTAESQFNIPHKLCNGITEDGSENEHEHGFRV